MTHGGSNQALRLCQPGNRWQRDNGSLRGVRPETTQNIGLNRTCGDPSQLAPRYPAPKTVQHTGFRHIAAAAQTHLENPVVISTESVDILSPSSPEALVCAATHRTAQILGNALHQPRIDPR